jgi:hypothetical protein
MFPPVTATTVCYNTHFRGSSEIMVIFNFKILIPHSQSQNILDRNKRGGLPLGASAYLVMDQQLASDIYVLHLPLI